MPTLFAHQALKNTDRNKLAVSDRQFHDWYRFVLSYPPHLVDQYLNEFNLKRNDIVLDPFCGTGTTIVEAKIQGVASVGVEANPLAHFASSVKTKWNIDASALLSAAHAIRTKTSEIFASQGLSDTPTLKNLQVDGLLVLPIEQEKILLKNSISPVPLHKSLVLLEQIQRYKPADFYNHLLLAFANALVYQISNLRFGPEVGLGRIKPDAAVVTPWFNQVLRMSEDLTVASHNVDIPSDVVLGDARELSNRLNGKKISAVITSPPYPNEKDYTRTTRLESVLLGFINSKEELQRLKKTLVRSNTRGVYKADKDDEFVNNFPEIQRIATEIEKRRLELGKTSGFEKLYPRVTKLYFGGMAKHLSGLRSVLNPNAHLAYVVGDQASYLRIMIRTGHLLADIATSLGYELIRIDLFRTRFSTATKSDLNEEVVILRWKG